ncbi:HAD-IIIA family hydrolase [Agathobaculum sp. NTUH-O15-33]|uniref:HAD-IIIA family hydrolase n=1 Tax=Agathobaculum sp. NTUH-O15-33 TaxID=3079302 RepID=UPI002958A07F|nr:HAD-IIIA family hydrolase [Agathobaculum sp. NTUH-O15-33]WNX84092.1 HAD-IIIA family hydrolase [Agathobaculum sp. NTUH-O15-33]
MREAIVLAGGFGTRLAHIVSDVPKPMAPVCGRPFLRFILDDLQAKGIERVVLAVGYKQEVIRNFFGEAYRGMQVIYSSEETPLFTGGAIKQALRLCREQQVLVANGDTYFDVDLSAMERALATQPGAIILAAKRMFDFDRYGVLELEGDRVAAFQEKTSCREGLINGGIYLLEKTALDHVQEDAFSFETAVLEPAAQAGKVYAVEQPGYFIDIGVPEDYAAAQQSMKERAPVNRAAFFDRDGTINVDIHYLHRPEDLQFIEGMPQFIRKWNDWGYKVIVVTNQAGIARGYYTENDMRALHRYMNERLAEYGAHIDAFYFCPHHPDITGPCHCRKPEPGMIEDAIRDFDLDPAQCLIFGDKSWDIEAGKQCKIQGYIIS